MASGDASFDAAAVAEQLVAALAGARRMGMMGLLTADHIADLICEPHFGGAGRRLGGGCPALSHVGDRRLHPLPPWIFEDQRADRRAASGP